jgi:RND superfamily putative drug exporter
VPKAFQQSHQEQVSAGAAGRSGFVDDAPTDSYPTSTA